MPDQTAAALYFLAPFAVLWTAFAIAAKAGIAALENLRAAMLDFARLGGRAMSVVREILFGWAGLCAIAWAIVWAIFKVGGRR